MALRKLLNIGLFMNCPHLRRFNLFGLTTLSTFLGLFYLVFSAHSIAADHSKISLEQYLAKLIESHPFLQAEAMSRDVEIVRTEAIQRGESWTIQAQPYYRYEEPVNSSVFASEEVKSFGGSTELIRPIWSSGGTFSFGYEGSSVDQKNPPVLFPGNEASGFQSVLPEFVSHRAFIAYSQPLIKNRGGQLDRVPIDLQEIRAEQSFLQSLENAEDFILSRATEFLNWALMWELAEIAKEREDLALSQMQETQKKRVANYVDEVDLIRAENNYLQAQQRTLSMNARAEAEAVKVSIMMGDLSFKSAKPKLGDADSKSVWPEGGAESRILKLLQCNIDLRLRDLKRFENAKEIDLTLEMMGGLASGDERFDDSASFDQPIAQVGLVFRHPLGKHPDAAEVERLKLEVSQEKFRYANAERNLRASQAILNIRKKELSQLIELCGQQMKSAAAKTVAEEEMYQQGRSSLNFVIQSRDEEALVKSQLAENKVAYLKAQLEYEALNDLLFLGF